MVLGAETIFIVDLLAIFAVYVIVNLSLNLEFGIPVYPNSRFCLCYCKS